MFQRLLVLLDGSLRAEQTIPIAARITRASRGMLVLIHTAPVYGSDTPGESAFSQARLRMQLDGAQQYLTAIAASQELAGLPLTVAALPGPVVSATVSAIHTYQPDLLVLCEQSSPHEPYPFIGDLARQLIKRVTLPLLLVPPHGSYLLCQKRPLTLLVGGERSQPAPYLMKPAAALLAALATGGQGRLRSVSPHPFLASPSASVVNKRAGDRRGSFADGETGQAGSTAVSLQEIPVGEELDQGVEVNDADVLVLGVPGQDTYAEQTLRTYGYPWLSQRNDLPLLLVPQIQP